MKLEYKLLLAGCLTIGLFDAIGSFASRHFTFNYTYLAAISFTIYCVFGFIATKQVNLKTGVLIAAAIGLFDSTVGWEISILLKANTGNIKIEPSIVVWIATMMLVVGSAALCGLIGGGVAKLFKKKAPSKVSDQ